MQQTTRLRSSRLVAVAAALALVAAGCGGDEDPEASETPSATDMATEESEMATDMATDESEMATDTATDASGDVAVGTGVTAEACPEAVNPDNGCIYLGVLSDLTEGPFAPLAVPITAAQEAFWQRVNDDGGIGGAYDVDISEYTRDNKYNPEIHNQFYQEIKPNILAIAQTLGSPTTAAIIDDMVASDIVGAPASWTSLWDTIDPGTNIVESGNSYCIESMNAIDSFVEEAGGVGSVVALHLAGDYGEDGAAGAKIAAEANGASFSHVEFGGADSGSALEGAIGAMLSDPAPDVVMITATPTQLAEIVGGAAAQGFQGRIYGNSPTWNPALLDTAAGPALEALYIQAGPWASYDTDTPGHNAMREALGDVPGNDGYTSGWAWSYPMQAALEQAYGDGDLTRAGVLAAVTELDAVDYEGMLPPEAGNFAGSADEQAFRGTVFSEPDSSVDSGVSTIGDFYTGPTAADYAFEGACYQTVDLDG